MARLRPLTQDEVPPKVAAQLAAAAKIFSAPLMSSGIPAYCPPILEAGPALSAAPALSGKLPPASTTHRGAMRPRPPIPTPTPRQRCPRLIPRCG